MSLSDDEVNTVLNLIATNQLSLQVCSIFEDAFSISYLQSKNTASESDIFFADLLSTQHSKVALKVWMGWDEIPKIDDDTIDQIRETFDDHFEEQKTIADIIDKIDNPARFASLTYERKVYQYLTENIIMNDISNNFIPLVAYGSCDITKILDDIMKSGLMSIEKLIIGRKFRRLALIPGLKMYIMATGSTDLKKLKPLRDMNLDSLPLQQVANIIFQVLHAIFILQNIHMNQGDLHLGNILVEELSEERRVSVGEDMFIRTKYIPKIYDFDHSYLEHLGPNPLLENNLYLNSLRSVNKFRLNQDYYQFICGLKSMGSRNVNTILSEILPKPSFSAWKQRLNIHDEPDDIVLNVGSKVVSEFMRFLAQHPNKGLSIEEAGESILFIAVDVPFFMENIPASSLATLSRDKIERLKNADNVWLSIMNSNKIVILGGWLCHPVEDPSHTILHNLTDLFTRPDMFTALTKYVSLERPANDSQKMEIVE